MKVTDSIILKSDEGDGYRVMLVEAPVAYLSEEVQQAIANASIDLREIIIERIQGGNVTKQRILHQISNWLAGCFADNQNMVLFYLCDDMNPIPLRNEHGSHRTMSVQEYRSRLFSRLFNTYINSHNISGVFNNPIRIDGVGYSYFIHIIARERHSDIEKQIANDVMEGFGI